MLVVFFALSTAVALVIRRPLLDRLVVLASAVPIAVVSNIVRVAATGVLHETTDSATANAFFHDAAGWFMMPLALGMLGIELRLLSALLPVVPAAAVPPPRRRAAAPAARAARTPAPLRLPARRPAVPPREAAPPAPQPDPVAADRSADA
jgi:exosortase/archaeosortase family protein